MLKMILRKHVILATVMLTMLSSLAQWRQPQMINLSSDEGLFPVPHEVMESYGGMMYVRTGEGLYRYNGASFEFFGHNPADTSSIGLGEVLSMTQTTDSLIWLGLRYGGLNLFDPKTEKFTHFQIPSNQYTDAQIVTSLLVDKSNIIWVGSNKGRLLKFNTADASFEEHHPTWLDFNTVGRYDVSNMMEDQNDQNIIWFSLIDFTPENSPIPWFGLVQFNKLNGEFVPKPCAGFLKAQDEKGNLWSTMGFGYAVCYNPTNNSCEKIDISQKTQGDKFLSMDILFDENEALFSVSSGILSLDEQRSFNIVAQSPKIEIYKDLYRDSQNRLWICGQDGIKIWDKTKRSIDFCSLEEYGVDQRIYPSLLALDVDREIIYVNFSGWNRPSRIYSIPLDKSQPTTFISTDFVPGALATDKDGGLLIKNGTSLTKIERADKTHSKPQTSIIFENMPPIYSLQKNNHGWFAGLSHENFVWFHEANKKFHHILSHEIAKDSVYTENHSNFRGFTFGMDEKAYLISNQVYELNFHSQKIQTLSFSDLSTESNSVMTSVAFDEENNSLWIGKIGTISNYIIRNDSLILLTEYSAIDGLFGTQFRYMTVSGSKVWLFGEFGLFALDKTTREIRHFDLSDGLANTFMDPYEVLQLKDGRLATVNGTGIIVFHPDTLWKYQNANNIKTVITGIRIDGKPYGSEVKPDFISSIIVPNETKIIDFAFQGLAYPKDDFVKYSYRLLGYQDEWVNIGSNKYVSFSSLPSGNFTLQIKASTATEMAPIKELHIHALIPLFLRWYICIPAIIFIGGLLYFLGRKRIEHVRNMEWKKRQNERKLADLEMSALRSQMNPHFMFNTLNSIKSYIIKSETKFAAEYLSNFAHLVRLTLQGSRKNLNTLDEELEILILYIELEKLRFKNKFEFSCQLDQSIDMTDVFIPPLLLQPYVENAIWHGLMGKEDGRLSLKVKQFNETVQCIIEDNGIGRKAANNKASNTPKKYDSLGMTITEQRIELSNKMENINIKVNIIDLKDESNKALGTRVIIELKK